LCYTLATVLLVTNNAAGGTANGYRFTRDLSGTTLWVGVEGGDLPVPIEILVDRAPGGRHIFTGLRIGDGAQEITSQTMRRIKLGEILAAHFEVFEPVFRMEASLALASRPLRPRVRRRGPAGPDDEALLAFAETYKAELGRSRRAMTAAANTHNISRTTANRWAARCRELGYLTD
jgi:hypothetical protein